MTVDEDGEPLAVAEDGPPRTVEVRTVRAQFTEIGYVNVAARHHQVVVDESPRYGGHDTGPNPVEHLLAGLASTSLVVLRIVAGEESVAGVSVTVEGELNVARIRDPRTTGRVFNRLDLIWDIPDDLDQAQFEQWLGEVAQRRPGQGLLSDATATDERVRSATARTDQTPQQGERR